MRIAVIHNLRAGGAARRLGGTLQALGAHPGLTMREFTLSTAVDLAVPTAGASRVAFVSAGDTAARWARPPLRYADLVRLRTAWREVAAAVNAWQPDAVFANPCGVSYAAPSALKHVTAPSLYYCDEPRRVDYEPVARASTNPATRAMYGPLRATMRRDDRAAMRAATVIATNSSYSAAGILAAYGRQAEVVPPGVAEIFAPGTDRAQPRHILSVGTLIPSKGHDLAVRAVGQVGIELPLLVVAPRPNPPEEQRLRQVAAAAGVPLQIRIAVSDHELADLYRSAFVTMYLARAEPLGLVSLESQACGTPVIVADEGGLGNTVVDSVTGYRIRRDHGAAADRLAELDRDGRREQMAQHCAKTAPYRDIDAGRSTMRLLSGLVDADGGRGLAHVRRERVA